MHYAGIDLHRNTLMVAVETETGNLRRAPGRNRRSPSASRPATANDGTIRLRLLHYMRQLMRQQPSAFARTG